MFIVINRTLVKQIKEHNLLDYLVFYFVTINLLYY